MHPGVIETGVRGNPANWGRAMYIHPEVDWWWFTYNSELPIHNLELI